MHRSFWIIDILLPSDPGFEYFMRHSTSRRHSIVRDDDDEHETHGLSENFVEIAA